MLCAHRKNHGITEQEGCGPVAVTGARVLLRGGVEAEALLLDTARACGGSLLLELRDAPD
jgi:hypothetical protein